MELSEQNKIQVIRAELGGLLGRALSFLKTVGFVRRPRALRVRETLALGERRQLLVVEWESQSYLLGATPQGIVLLDRHASAEIPKETEE